MHDRFHSGDNPSAAPAHLSLHGTARLEYEHHSLPLRRRGLALLYYLALEGPTNRGRLAEVLWGRMGAANNLRVELHRIRQVFRQCGMNVFSDRQDPLRLPAVIRVVRNTAHGEPLAGLDDITAEFQDWLELKRVELAQPSDTGFEAREGLLRELLSSSRQPRAIALKGAPGDGRQHFASRLAHHLGRPLTEGARHSGDVIRYLTQPLPSPAEVVDRIVEEKRGSWVLECSAFGDDPDLILELRDRLPADEMRFLELPPLTWSEASHRYSPGVPFVERARMFLAAGSNLRFLNELIALRPPQGFGESLPIPQRITAAFYLEMRTLTRSAVLALERLSAHPGAMSEGLVEALDAGAHLEELERQGWLAFAERWTFRNQTARLVLYDSLQEGRRRTYHRRAADQAAAEQDHLAEAYHRLAARDDVDALLQRTSGWAHVAIADSLGVHPAVPGDPPMTKSVSAAERLAVLERWTDGPGLEHAQGPSDYVIVRRINERQPTRLGFELPDEASLLRLSGRAYIDNVLGVGLSGDAVPLTLDISGRQLGRVVFAGTDRARELDEGVLLLPLQPEFEHWIAVADATGLVLSSRAENGVIEISVEAFRSDQHADAGSEARHAFTLPQRTAATSMKPRG